MLARSSEAAAGPDRVCLGAITGAHGIRGAVRIKPFTADPHAVGAYGQLSDEAGARFFRLQVADVRGGVVIAAIAGITDRNAAERLKGVRLYVPRSALPPPEDDEFYHADLIGLRAELEDGTPFGRVRAVDNFGAGDVIELQPAGGGAPLLLPFTREFVPVVDMAAGRIVVAPPEEGDTPERGGDAHG